NGLELGYFPSPDFKVLTNVRGGHWPSHKEPLNFGTMLSAQYLELSLGLNTFSDYLYIEASAHRQNGVDDRQCARVFAQPAYKRLVDLDLIEGKLAQIAQTGVSGSK